MKIIFIASSGALYKHLYNIQESLKGEVKVKIIEGELQIGGFKGFEVEAKHHMSEINVPAVNLKQLMTFLKHITDQPLTIVMEDLSRWIEIKNVFI